MNKTVITIATSKTINIIYKGNSLHVLYTQHDSFIRHNLPNTLGVWFDALVWLRFGE